MPVLISDNDYKEYRTLQNNSIFQQKLRSIRGLNNLKYDIDAPIRNLVALFALLDCQPVWSCCGFDYDGQPMHKSHEYGDAFIAFLFTERSREVMMRLVEKSFVIERKGSITETDKWEAWLMQGQLYLRTDFDYFHREWKYPWATKSCIHYPELAIYKIHEMEQALLSLFHDEFLDEAILKDTNRNQKKHVKNWQYPTLEDWLIRKEEIFGGLDE